jgi:riboflavin kinase/FMN adenylyltransferase
MKIARFHGKIVKGKGLGRTVGMPTLNLQWDSIEAEIYPPYGVYISKLTMGLQYYYGVTNFGYRPSVDAEDRVTLETFLMDFNGEGLGEEVEVELLYFLRSTQKKASLEDVKLMVEHDMASAKTWLLQNQARKEKIYDPGY